MKYFFLSAILLIAAPVSAVENDSVQNISTNLVTFLSEIVVPFLFALALLFFIFNVVRYFIIQRGLQGRYSYGIEENAKTYALYGLGGMILMTLIWGIVNLVVGGTGLGREEVVCPDYLPEGYCEGAATPDPAPGFGGADFGGDDPTIRREGEFGGSPTVDPEARSVAPARDLRDAGPF